MSEELTAFVLELKKSKDLDFTFTMTEKDEDEEEYTDPIPALGSKPRTEDQVPTTIGTIVEVKIVYL